MNNEPVAWMIIDVDNGKSLQFEENKFSEINIPLYTAPRELSDEEIKAIANNVCYLFAKDKKGRTKGVMYIEDFARAIIKASRGEE